MADIPVLLKMLEDKNANKRYDACEQLRVAPSIPEEALTALQEATQDPNPEVADAAKRALAIHTPASGQEGTGEVPRSMQQTTDLQDGLNTASWFVIWGALVICGEHAQFTLTYVAGVVWPEAQRLVLIPHARIHFFMAGVYTIIGLVLLGVIARTLLKEGRRAGWYALLFAVVAGGGIELIMGGLWYQHGSPVYLMERPLGWGWVFLYSYLVAWIAALVLSYKPIFTKLP